MASNERPITFQESELLQFLDAEGYSPNYHRCMSPRFGLTVDEYCAAHRCSKTVARRCLDEAVADGKLVKNLMSAPNSPRVMVYCRPEQWPPKG